MWQFSKVYKITRNVSHSIMTPWSIDSQTPLSMGFSKQEYWSGLPFPSPGDLPDPEIILGSSVLQADSLPSEPPWKPHMLSMVAQIRLK